MTGGLFEQGAYSNEGLISKFRAIRGLFEYGGLIGTEGLNEDLRYATFIVFGEV